MKSMPSSSIYGFNTPPSEEPTHAGVWQSLRENTTAHGIPHINNAKGAIKKTIWSVISLAVLGSMIFHLFSLFNAYFQYKVNVQMSIVSKTHMVFPAVTVCNMNPIKNSLISRSEALSFLLSNSQTKRRRKRQTSGTITWYRLDSENSYQYRSALSETSTDLGSYRDEAQRIIIDGESAWVLDVWNGGDSQFFCPGTYEEDMSGITVLNVNADAMYKISHACGEPVPATGSLDAVSNGDTCARDYTVTCNSNTPFNDGQTTKTLTCSASLNAYGGSMDVSQISHCFDAAILYENVDKSGANFIVTADSEVDFHWQNRASAVTVTGPNHWVFYKDTGFSTSQDYFSFCPGEYQASTDFDDDSINSMARGTTALCPTVQTYSNTQYTVDSTSSCWVVTYTCDSGYFSDGSASNSLTCTGGRNRATGTWTGTVPDCEALTTTEEPTTTTEATTTEQTTTVEPTTTSHPTTTAEETTTTEATTTVLTTDELTTTIDKTTTYVKPQTTTFLPTTTEDSTTTSASTSSTTTYPPELEEPRREDFLLQENVIETLADMPEEERSSLGYQAADMLLDCGYEGRDCDISSDFAHFYDPVLGNCYTYNSGRTEQDISYSYRTGQRYGFSLVVNIDQEEYTDKLIGPAGARIVVHNQGIMPFPNDLGILVRPGELLSVGVRKVNVARLPDPYGNCTSYYNDGLLDMYVGLYGVEYTVMGCTKTCYQKEVVKQCGCGDPSYPLSSTIFEGETVSSCSWQNIQQVACQIELELAFSTGDIHCECPERCSDSYYTTDVSTAQWPATKHKSSVVEGLESKNVNFTVYENFSVSDNILKLEVYFQEFNFEEVTQIPAYRISQLMSDLGGAFGLWFGLSVLSFFEFFEFFLDMSVISCFRCCKKNSGNKRSWQPAEAKHKGRGSDEIHSPPPPYRSQASSNSRRIKTPTTTSPSQDHPKPPAPRYHNYITDIQA